jgi:hypothetical protein
LGAAATLGSAAHLASQASSVPASGLTVSASAAAPALSLKVGVALAVAALAAGGGTLTWRLARPAAVQQARTQVDARRRPIAVVERTPLAPAARPAGPLVSGALRPGASRTPVAGPRSTAPGRSVVRQPVADKTAPKPREESDTVRSEVRLIDAARAAAATDPGRAVQLCLQHERSFPRGIMREEREAILIAAWASLGRPDEARARQASFDRAYPASPYGAGLRARLAE